MSLLLENWKNAGNVKILGEYLKSAVKLGVIVEFYTGVSQVCDSAAVAS